MDLDTRNLLYAICSLLHKVEKNSMVNQLKNANLARILAPVLLRKTEEYDEITDANSSESTNLASLLISNPHFVNRREDDFSPTFCCKLVGLGNQIREILVLEATAQILALDVSGRVSTWDLFVNSKSL